MPIHDLGYRSWEGSTTSPSTRWLVIAGSGIRLVWNNRWIRRMMFLAWMPTCGMAFVFFMYEQMVSIPPESKSFGRQMAEEVLLQSDTLSIPEVVKESLRKDSKGARHDVWSFLLFFFFSMPQLILLLLVVGLISPPLISRDVRSRAFLLYFARPIHRVHYIAGKAAVILFYVTAITTIPALTLYFLGVLLSPDIEVVLITWDLPLRIIGASLVLAIPTTMLALCLSSMTTESRYASFTWFAIWMLGWVAYLTMRDTSALTQQQQHVWAAENSVYQFEHVLRTKQDFFDSTSSFSSLVQQFNLMFPQFENWSDAQFEKEHLRRQQKLHAERKSLERIESDQEKWSAVSLHHMLSKTESFVFGLEDPPSEVLPSAVALFLITCGSTIILFRRVSSPMRI